MGFQERAQARHLPGNPSSSVQPPLLKLEVAGLAGGDTTHVLEVVYPVLTYNCQGASLVGCSPQMENGGGVQNLLDDLLSLPKAEDLGMDFLDLRKILFVQLEPSFTEGCLRVVASALSASDSFHTLEGVAPSLELVVMALWSRFRSLRGSLTLRLRRGGSSSGIGLSALSESVLEASLICSWTC